MVDGRSGSGPRGERGPPEVQRAKQGGMQAGGSRNHGSFTGGSHCRDGGGRSSVSSAGAVRVRNSHVHSGNLRLSKCVSLLLLAPNYSGHAGCQLGCQPNVDASDCRSLCSLRRGAALLVHLCPNLLPMSQSHCRGRARSGARQTAVGGPDKERGAVRGVSQGIFGVGSSGQGRHDSARSRVRHLPRGAARAERMRWIVSQRTFVSFRMHEAMEGLLRDQGVSSLSR